MAAGAQWQGRCRAETCRDPGWELALLSSSLIPLSPTKTCACVCNLASPWSALCAFARDRHWTGRGKVGLVRTSWLLISQPRRFSVSGPGEATPAFGRKSKLNGLVIREVGSRVRGAKAGAHCFSTTQSLTPPPHRGGRKDTPRLPILCTEEMGAQAG